MYVKWANLNTHVVKSTNRLAIDNAVFNWFYKVQNKNIPVLAPILKEKALDVAKSITLKEFKAFNGWSEKFCPRHKISFKMMCGKSANVDMQSFFD